MRVHPYWVFVVCTGTVFPGLASGRLPTSAPVPQVGGSAKASNPLEQSLIEAQHSLNTAMAKHDGSYLKNTLADDFIAIDPSGNTYGKGDLLEYAGGGPREEKGPKPILYDFKVVVLNDNAGVVSYNIVLPDSHPRYLHMSSTWVRQDGAWKLKFEQATPNLWSAQDLD